MGLMNNNATARQLPYELLDWGGKRLIWLDSDRLEECMAYVRQEHLDGVAISPHNHYRLSNLDFLKDHVYVKGVVLPDAGSIDISALAALCGLDFLSVDGSGQPLELEWFPRLRELRLEWHSRLSLAGIPGSLQILSLRRYRPEVESLVSLPDCPCLKDLSIIQSPIRSTDGVERFRALRRLEFSYMPKLETLSALGIMNDALLEELECQRCPSLKGYDVLSDLRSLRKLKLNACCALPDIKFIGNMVSLEEFRFVSTNVIDGDLSPLLKLTTLRDVAYTNKRHFSHKWEQVTAELRNPGRKRGQKPFDGGDCPA